MSSSAEGSQSTAGDGEAPWKRMPEQLVDWVREFDALKDQRRGMTYRDPMELRDGLDARIDALAERVQVVGLTAAFFGGFEGMRSLHDAAEALVGRDNSVGFHLNRLWDGIGGWWA